ncbi:uncharacterized protein LOC113389439 [Ctenocephalides felis]|uniref:uncharacterized protein LOC113389439 n=1 Tax=Ctenocephalides felis TaxID=7515 RepID=UPI000E6E250A|nr:uncharacterized protein LOC113389439 [Ctenocephalides felis]
MTYIYRYRFNQLPAIASNAFVVNAALSDLLISGLLVPSSAVVLLAGADDSIALCRFQWFLASTSFLVTAFTMALIAGENLSRVYPDRPSNKVFLTPARCACSIALVWLVCVMVCSVPQIMKNQEAEDLIILKGKSITRETMNDGFPGLDYCARRFRKLGRQLDDTDETRAGPIALLVTVCVPCSIALLLHIWARHRVSKEQQRACSRSSEHKSPEE